MALLKGPSVFVHLDPRHDDVVVPKWFKKQAQLVLQVGLNMAVTIPDLDVTDDGITATLSFSRSPFWCFMPWSAIYAIVGEDGRGMVWPEDVPGEVAAKPKPALKVVGSKKARKKTAKPEGKLQIASAEEPTKRGALKAVAAPRDEAAKDEVAKDEAAKSEAASDDAAAVASPEGADDTKSKLPSYLRVIK